MLLLASVRLCSLLQAEAASVVRQGLLLLKAPRLRQPVMSTDSSCSWAAGAEGQAATAAAGVSNPIGTAGPVADEIADEHNTIASSIIARSTPILYLHQCLTTRIVLWVTGALGVSAAAHAIRVVSPQTQLYVLPLGRAALARILP
jgi:hypothetical protein